MANVRGSANSHKLYEYLNPTTRERYVAVGVGDALPSDLVHWIAACEAQGVTPQRVGGVLPASFLGAKAARWIAGQRRAELGDDAR